MRAYCPKCGDKVTIAFGRCKQCGGPVTSTRRFDLANIALTVGQIISLLGCAGSLLGFVWSAVWGVNSLNPDDVFLHLALTTVGSAGGFFYSLAMWFVFSRVKKLE